MTGPLVPGKLGELQWVDSPDYGDRPDERRIPRVYDVDPAPLARMLGIAEGDPFTPEQQDRSRSCQECAKSGC
jgi:hypothetical protein